ncbi:MAG: tRNA (adenosine(37)-N6)-threonylcarbamoyltransferase complex dimerization subunit type 1 TsaB [Planctomycetes bacterium]|nr:tRNA (adenosine(37)-N6)-threonylcarbamoyltransferase complex dimerization subunit type 1 TsaB [Planctomycetota bacterium]
MRVLGLESAGPRGGVALHEESRVRSEILFEKGMVHGRDIAPAVDRMLRDVGWRPADLDLVTVDIGPGSYTGVRVGLAAAKGLAVALGRPILGVPSLDAIAHVLARRPERILAPALDAKWDQIYGALYEAREGAARRTTEMFAEPPEAFAARVPEGALVAGDALERHAALFAARGAALAPKEEWAPRPSVIAELGRRRYENGERDDVAKLAPLYLRPTEAEVKFGKKSKP